MGITQQIGASSLIKPGVIDNTAARPASPYEGQVIFQKDTDQLLVWNGTAWVIPNSPAQNPQGLELIKQQTIGTAVTSVTVSDAFSATYDNYLVVLSGGACTGETNIGMQLGSKTTNYKSQLIYANWGASITAFGNSTSTSVTYAASGGTNGIQGTIQVINPFLAKNTFVSGIWNASADTGTATGQTADTTSYTAFTMVIGGGSVTGGTIRVYGYRNS